MCNFGLNNTGRLRELARKQKQDLTTEFKIAFLEEYVKINDFDFNEVPSILIEYYIALKLKELA